MKTRVLVSVAVFFALTQGLPQLLAQQGYQKPPQAILDVLNAPIPPIPFVSPTRDTILLGDFRLYPPITDLAQPMLRLGGVRINPNSNSLHGDNYFVRYTLRRVAGGGGEAPVIVPADSKLSFPRWSADGKRFAFAITTSKDVELWVGETSGSVRRLNGVHLNPVLGSFLQWMPDQKTLLVKLVPSGRGAPPAGTTAPDGPDVQQSLGSEGPSSTYEVRDVLKNAHDADLFDYYAASQLAVVDAQTGSVSLEGKPALYDTVSSSPDGTHFLVTRIHRPYSYLHPYDRFPASVEVWDRKGEKVYTLADLPLADQVPINGVRTGPRQVTWRPTEPATLVWVEALDGGDPKKKVPNRDSIRMLSAPFNAAPRELFRPEQRFSGIWWGQKDGLVLVSDLDIDRRWRRTFLLNAADPAAKPQLIWDLSMNERYKDPGSPVFRVLPNGRAVMQQDGDWIYLRAQAPRRTGIVPSSTASTFARERQSDCSAATEPTTSILLLG